MTNYRYRLLAKGALLLAALNAAPSQAATFLDTIKCTVSGSNFVCQPSQAAINPAARFSEEFFVGTTTPLQAFLSADFTPGAAGAVLRIKAVNSVNLNFTQLQFENLSDYWTNFTFLGALGFGPNSAASDGLTANDLALTNGVLNIDLRGVLALNDRNNGIQHEFSVELIEGPRPVISAVPEPASWAMLILGFGLIGGAMRQQQGRMKAARFRATFRTV